MAAPGMRPESGWQTHGSNGGDPLASAIIWESISFLSLSRSQAQSGWVSNSSTLKFDSLDTQTGGREKNLTEPPNCPQLCSATRAIMEESSIMNREKSRLVG